MKKQSRRRKQHNHGKKPSRQDPRRSRSPASKEKRSASNEKASREPAQQPPQSKRRRKWMMSKKQKKRGYTKQEWYWGYISQNEAEEFMKDAVDGEFLVRSMMFANITKTILSVASVQGNTRKHHHFTTAFRGNKWQLDQIPSFHRTLIDLIAHYHQKYIGMTKLQLKTPKKQPDWFIRRRNVVCPEDARRLGGGNFSDVKLCAFRRRLVAVKILKCDGEMLQRERENLMKEATLMSKLQHPYITKMIGVSIDNPSPILLIEIMATSLIDHLDTYGPYIHFGEQLLYCWQMAAGLLYMSQQGIVHRDMAARNALFSRYGILKIADFGLSEMVINLAAVNSSKDTMPIKWYPPECVCLTGQFASFSEKSDVWSYGVTCNEIFNNGESPLPKLNNARGVVQVETIKKYKDGDALHVLPKKIPHDVQAFFKKIFMQNPADRPNFKEIFTTMDQWTKITYPPPPIEQQTVQMIRNCRPLTCAEYEILYHNNCDWFPAARKVKIKKGKKEKKERKGGNSKKSGRDSKKKPGEQLKSLRRKLTKRRKRERMREKLKWWREKRREEKKRVKELISLGKHHLRREVERSNGYKVVLEKFEKMVDLYGKLMMVRWRKRRPNRQTRFRLRRHRLINTKSKHPFSRNHKNGVVTKRGSQGRKTRVMYPAPMIPKIPKFVAKKQKQTPKTPMGAAPRRGSSADTDPSLMDELKQKRMRKVRKRQRRMWRKWNKMKQRNKRLGIRRQRRRQKLRRRHRKRKMELRRLALNVDQRERMRILKKRRGQKQALANRLRREARIGKILRGWRDLRTLIIFRKLYQIKKLELKKQKMYGKDGKPQEKKTNTGRRRSRN